MNLLRLLVLLKYLLRGQFLHLRATLCTGKVAFLSVTSLPFATLLRSLLLWTMLGLSLTACSRFEDEEHEKNVLLGLLVHEKYLALEQALAQADDDYRQNTLSPNDWQARWQALGNVSTGGILPRLNAWVSLTDSGAAYLVRGMYQQAHAGRELALEGVDEGKKRAAAERLWQGAQDDLLIAQKKINKCVLCLAERISLNRVMQRDPAESRKLMEEALSWNPHVHAPIFNYFAHIAPDEAGSLLQMRDFIEGMKKRGASPTLQAALESRYAWQQAQAAKEREETDNYLAWLEYGNNQQPYAVLMITLAELYTAREQHAEAVQVLEKNLEKNDPWDTRTIDLLMRAAFKAGQREKGQAMLEKRAVALVRDSEYQ